MKKHGFTMAEVLITMGIIGVVATIMIPIISDARPNTEMVMLKKAYYNTTRVVSELINDDELYPENDGDEAHDGFANTEITEQVGHEATFRGQTYSGDKKFCGLFAAKLSANGANCNSQQKLNDGGNFTTSDGMIWSVPVEDFSSGFSHIYVDVNGLNRGNNCALGNTGEPAAQCGEGQAPDQFEIYIGKYGEVSAPGELTRAYISSQNTTKKFEKFMKEHNYPD